MLRLGSVKINDHSLGLIHIKLQIICTAPALKQIDLLSVAGFIIPVNETHDRSVVCEFDNQIVFVPWHTVMSQQCVQQRAEQASLRGTCAQCDGFGD